MSIGAKDPDRWCIGAKDPDRWCKDPDSWSFVPMAKTGMTPTASILAGMTPVASSLAGMTPAASIPANTNSKMKWWTAVSLAVSMSMAKTVRGDAMPDEKGFQISTKLSRNGQKKGVERQADCPWSGEVRECRSG